MGLFSSVFNKQCNLNIETSGLAINLIKKVLYSVLFHLLPLDLEVVWDMQYGIHPRSLIFEAHRNLMDMLL